MKEIRLTKGQVALVDDEDFERISQYKWQATWQPHSKTYAARGLVGGMEMLMHRFILSAPEGVDVDHIHHNGLDNRKAEIRFCTDVENARNRRKRSDDRMTSQYKGVYVLAKYGKYRARIRFDGALHHLGYFDDEVSADLAYDTAARQHFGEFALTNFEEGKP